MPKSVARPAPARRRARGLTLLEVVIALLLFAMMSTVLLTGQGTAARAIERAEVMRDMAELLSFRLNMVALQPSEYQDGDQGEFPSQGQSTRLIDEIDVFSDRYEGYTWEVTIAETIGAGASGSVSIDGDDPRQTLFESEGTGGGDDAGDESDEELEADAVDRMLLITVTVYPPGWEDADRDEADAIQPRSAWTAIHLPTETEDSGNAR